MAAHIDTDDQYNISAAKYAATIHEVRKAANDKKISHLPSTNELFQSPFGSPGLGIALEYERMGNVPVSANLQTQADNYQVEFEHLGITLGTVIHNVNLRNQTTPEFIQFIRQTLLERKVIFFRNQHLDEDEHLVLSTHFPLESLA